jgi:hypothetical protein
MQNLPPNNNRVTFEQAFLASLLLPETGARMATMGGPDTKIMAKIFVAPGGGLDQRLRQGALVHEAVFVTFRGDVYGGRPAPACAEFDATTLEWAVRKSRQVAIWTAPFPDYRDDVATWMVDTANAGSTFQTIIETVPSRAAEWAAAVDRWKDRDTEVRFFGPEGIQ